jgi:hypothetical protein
VKTNIFICGQEDDATWYPEDSKFIEITPDTKSKSKFFNPFFMGPVTSYDGLESLTFENYWQRSLVYEEDWDTIYNCPLPSFFLKRQKAFSTDSSVRNRHLTEIDSFCFWNGSLDGLTLPEARINIYIPIYTKLVFSSEFWISFQDFIFSFDNVVLYDYDSYNPDILDMDFRDVIADSSRTMGPSFILRQLLYSCMI